MAGWQQARWGKRQLSDYMQSDRKGEQSPEGSGSGVHGKQHVHSMSSQHGRPLPPIPVNSTSDCQNPKGEKSCQEDIIRPTNQLLPCQPQSRVRRSDSQAAGTTVPASLSTQVTGDLRPAEYQSHDESKYASLVPDSSFDSQHYTSFQHPSHPSYANPPGYYPSRCVPPGYVWQAVHPQCNEFFTPQITRYQNASSPAYHSQHASTLSSEKSSARPGNLRQPDHQQQDNPEKPTHSHESASEQDRTDVAGYEKLFDNQKTSESIQTPLVQPPLSDQERQSPNGYYNPALPSQSVQETQGPNSALPFDRGQSSSPSHRKPSSVRHFILEAQVNAPPMQLRQPQHNHQRPSSFRYSIQEAQIPTNAPHEQERQPPHEFQHPSTFRYSIQETQRPINAPQQQNWQPQQENKQPSSLRYSVHGTRSPLSAPSEQNRQPPWNYPQPLPFRQSAQEIRLPFSAPKQQDHPHPLSQERKQPSFRTPLQETRVPLSTPPEQYWQSPHALSFGRTRLPYGIPKNVRNQQPIVYRQYGQAAQPQLFTTPGMYDQQINYSADYNSG